MANLDVQVAVLTERLDHIEEEATERAKIQTQMAQDIAWLKNQLTRYKGFVGGVMFCFSCIGAFAYYLLTPALNFFKMKHG